MLLALLLWGCSLSGEASPTEEVEPTADEADAEDEEPAPTAIPPTETPIPLDVDIVITGEEETVFDWTTDRCFDEDIPDLPARAWRDSTGQVYLLAAHIEAQPLVGPDLDNLTRNCDVIMSSTRNADPSMHSDGEWLAAVYTDDGITFFGLIHNEYQGWEHDNCAAAPGEHFECWYNTITLAASTDGGRTFTRGRTPPEHFIAGWPTVYEAGTGPYGVFSPSNIIEKDGYYYAIIKTQKQYLLNQWPCMMRTPDLSDPGAWRFWDGEAFEGEFVDPYASEVDIVVDHACDESLDFDTGPQMIESLTYNTEIERYVALGTMADHIDGREVWGYYFALSEDLITWTRRELIVEIPLTWSYEPGDGPHSYLYPSLIDPDSESPIFATTDNQAYLYYTRFFVDGFHLDRDLVRVPIEFVVR